MSARPKTTIYVSGLTEASNEATLYQQFATFGEIIDVQLPKNKRGNEEIGHRGFAFIVFASDFEAEDAIDNMNLNEVDGQVVSVSLSRPLKGTLAAMVDSKKAIWEDEVSSLCVQTPSELTSFDRNG